MAFTQKEGYGALFQNEEKEGNQPDYRGNCMINRKVYALSGWKKKDRNGKPFLSLTVKPEWKGVGTATDPDDEVPF